MGRVVFVGERMQESNPDTAWSSPGASHSARRMQSSSEAHARRRLVIPEATRGAAKARRVTRFRLMPNLRLDITRLHLPQGAALCKTICHQTSARGKWLSELPCIVPSSKSHFSSRIVCIQNICEAQRLLRVLSWQ